MPSQVKAIKAYREPQPLFARHGIESQLDAMFSTTVTLKSGGYIVINPTEALVSIDVNSGRSTREHNIEDTAVKTNLEAAEEVARQLRLRDLAGLIVIDFIDMEEHRNNRTVEKRLKDCLKNDRARIQVGRISPFGLMEMSRQRMRTGVLESSTMPCPHCGGSGFLRSVSSVALLILRGIEEALLKNAQFHINIKTRTEVALYILNQKRLTLREIEKRFGVTIAILADDSMHGTNYYLLERGDPAPEGGLRVDDTPIVEEIDEDVPEDDFEVEAVEASSDESNDEASEDAASADRDSENGGRRGRRRRRRGGRDREREPRGERSVSTSQDGEGENDAGANDEEGDDSSQNEGDSPEGRAESGERDGARRRRRRGRRGGRRNRFEGEEQNAAGDSSNADAEGGEAVSMTEEPAPISATPEPVVDEAPVPKKRGRKKAEVTVEAAEGVAEATAEPIEKPKRGRAKKVVAEAVAEAAPAPVLETVAEPAVVQEAPAAKKPEPKPVIIEPEIEDPNRPKRSGWWSKAKKALGGD
jgi:ribonuclease E